MSVRSTRARPPASRVADGPAASVLAATIARRYYLEGASKSEIAEDLGLSRFKVARVLENARETGLVRIELHYEGELNLDLSVRLAAHLGLRRCLVVDAPEGDLLQLRTALGRVAAGLLTEIVEKNDVVGLAWSRTLKAMASSLVGLQHCSVVQLTGALSLPDVDEGSIELVREVARIAGGPAFCFYAPMIVPAAGTARSLQAQPEVGRAMERFSSVTKAVVSIGGWRPGDSTVVDAIPVSEFEEGVRLGACGELCGIQLDEHGSPVTTSLSERIVGITAAELRAIPEIIAVAYGSTKAVAVRAAARGGFVTDLITHASLADHLLELP